MCHFLHMLIWLFIIFMYVLILYVVSFIVSLFEIKVKACYSLWPKKLNFPFFTKIPRRASTCPCCTFECTLKLCWEFFLRFFSGIHTSNIAFDHVFHQTNCIIHLTNTIENYISKILSSSWFNKLNIQYYHSIVVTTELWPKPDPGPSIIKKLGKPWILTVL